MYFESEINKQRKKHGIALLAASAIIVALWIYGGNTESTPIIFQMNVIIIMQYVAMIGTGFCIWYGYNTYQKIADLLKRKDTDEEKQDNYLSAKRFQYKLIYIALAMDMAMQILTYKDQFAFTAVCAIIFGLISMHSISKFETDFYEPIYEEDIDEAAENSKMEDNDNIQK
ncbi:MAG: hypothetical protein MJZ61_07040 [Bacteroidales bacterium]|nr:hypothetical protein [Bacteroidales bacterium]